MPRLQARTEAQGIASLDDFIARHAEIVVGDGAVRLPGKGEGTLQRRSLAALAKTWSGENYWFWARRVLRKLRHGIRRAGQHRRPARRRGRDAGRDPGASRSSPTTSAWWRAPWPTSASTSCASSPRATAGPTRRRASPPPAPTTSSTTPRPSRRSRRRSATSTGCAPPPRASAICAKPVLTPEQAVAEMRAAHRPGRALRHLFGPRAQRPRDRARSPTPTPLVMIPVNSRFRLAQPGAGGAAPRLRVDEAAGDGHARAASRPTRRRCSPVCNLAARPPGDEGGAVRLLRAPRGASSSASASSIRRDKRAERGAKSAHHVLAHGRDGAGSPHPAWHCCNAGEGQRPRPQAVQLSRHDLAKF